VSTVDGTRRPPPGPPGELALAQVRGDPLAFVMRMTQTYGDFVRYRSAGIEATLLNHPRSIRHVMQTNAANYAKAGTPDLMILRPMLGEALMTSEGPSWERQRTALRPVFTRASVERFGALMTAATGELLDEWERRDDPAAAVEIGAAMTQLTLRIVAKALFAYDIGLGASAFGACVQTLNETMGHPDPADRAVAARFDEALREIRAIVERVAAERDEAGDAALLLEAHAAGGGSDVELRDQILTFLLAGHETTAKTLGWCLYLLSEHPAVAERLREELRATVGDRVPAVADMRALRYGWAVLQETLRLYPPVWISSRTAIAGDVVDGHAIPAGSLVCISPYALHRHPAFWEAPERFAPERFLAGGTFGPATGYMPFSTGPRQCIGLQFARVELQLVLSTILQRMTPRLVAGHPVEPEALVTLSPRHGLSMTLQAVAPAKR
jgi:cytochrome P450